MESKRNVYLFKSNQPMIATLKNDLYVQTKKYYREKRHQLWRKGCSSLETTVGRVHAKKAGVRFAKDNIISVPNL